MKKYYFLLIIIFLLPMFLHLNGARHPGKVNLEKEDTLLELDRKISKDSGTKGILEALYPFLTDHSALFPLDGHPLYGKTDYAPRTVTDARTKKETPKSKNTLVWEPFYSFVFDAGNTCPPPVD
ncbi:MAG: hypothetical protein GY940_33230 [bacterium]|nr:hypothetical protein [bacterium]